MGSDHRRRIFLRTLAVGIGAGALAGCGLGDAASATTAQAPAQGNRRLTFVWSPKATNNPVFGLAMAGGQDRAQELGDVDFQWVGPTDSNAEQQVHVLDDVVKKGCDGIGLSCNDADLLKPVIDMAMSKGIAVITWDSDSPGSRRITFYGQDVVKAAQKAAEIFISSMQNNPHHTYAVLTGVRGAPNLEARITAFRAVADQPASKLTWIATDTCNDDVQKAVEAVENRMVSDPDLGGWFFAGGWPLYGDINVMMHLLAARGKTRIVSWDTLPSELQQVQSGLVQGLIGQKYYGWGYDGVKIMHDIVVDQKQYGPFIDSGFDVVTTPAQATAMLQKWDARNFK